MPITISLEDGPAKGEYEPSRSPLYLRAVVGPEGDKHVLDLLEDYATDEEIVSVYQRSTDFTMFMCPEPGLTRFANYQHMPVSGDLTVLKDNTIWRQRVRQAVITGSLTLE